MLAAGRWPTSGAYVLKRTSNVWLVPSLSATTTVPHRPAHAFWVYQTNV